MQGPAELLPISSSGHLVLVPELLGWPYARLDPELRKAFEVAVHAGTAVALSIALRGEVAETARQLDAPRALGAVLAFLPPAVAGLALEDAIERRAGAPRRVAVAQMVAGMALAAADRRPDDRSYEAAGALDHLLLGLAQAAALVPGVSRNGATLAAARWRRFTGEQANLLSRTVALPVILGATALKGARLRDRGVDPAMRRAMVAGVGSSFVSTLASQRLSRLVERDRALWPYAAYRVGLAAAVVARMGGG